MIAEYSTAAQNWQNFGKLSLIVYGTLESLPQIDQVYGPRPPHECWQTTDSTTSFFITGIPAVLSVHTVTASRITQLDLAA